MARNRLRRYARTRIEETTFQYETLFQYAKPLGRILEQKFRAAKEAPWDEHPSTWAIGFRRPRFGR
ncbi:hypothetical protein NJ7G_0105 [Natrinema sp. J7-2]|nr:hypothetical protein NJ7G_0105 [Natrinema sp. J7-2]